MLLTGNMLSVCDFELCLVEDTDHGRVNSDCTGQEKELSPIRAMEPFSSLKSH